MTASTAPGPRALLVVSKDQGELALAQVLLHGQAFAARSHLLLPVDPERSDLPLPIPTSFYATLAEIEAAIETFGPDLVVFLSAYWLPFRGVAKPKEVDGFLNRLRTQGRRLVTSDPFLGLAPHLTVNQIDLGMLALGRPAVARWLIRLVMYLRGPRASFIPLPNLDGVTHLYPVAPPAVAEDAKRVTFFNPTFARSASTGDSAVGGGTAPEPGGVPRWVFVLSETDVHCQSALMGARRFTEHVIHILQYALKVGRAPALIAPPTMLRRIASVSSEWGELLSFGRFADMERRLSEAEYAFFWDAFSCFQIPRLAAGRPVFHFDRGPFARAVLPYAEVARQCWFGGWEPKYLDVRQIFSPYVLAHLAKTQVDALAPVRERWRAAPTPDALVQRLLEY